MWGTNLRLFVLKKLPFLSALNGVASRRNFHDIWQMTWPQTVMLLCQFIIGITDIWAGGQIGSDVQASIGMVTQCQMLFMALAMAGVSGAVASISQSLGASQTRRARRYVSLVMIGGILIGCLLAWIGHLARIPVLIFVKTPENILPVASLFFSVSMLSLPGQYTITIGSAVFRAAKSVLKPLYVTIAVCVVNLFGDLAYGLGYWGFPNYGAAGVAWSTFASVTTGAILLLILLIQANLLTLDALPNRRWIKAGAPYLIKVAVPAFGTSALWQTGYLVLYVITASLPFGSVSAIAGLTAGLRVEGLLFMPAIAFNMTASVLVGHALGAGKRAEARRVIFTIWGIACCCMSFIGMCLWFWRPELAHILAPDPNVAQETVNYLTYNILSVPFSVTSIVLAGSLSGAGASVYPMLAFSAAVWMVRLPLAWYLGIILWRDASGIFLSMLISQIVQSSILFWIVLRCNWARFAVNHHSLKTGA